jgi:hypothetical protein
MAHSLDNNAPLGGMNSDDEFRSVPKGDFLTAKNIRVAINQTNKGGALQNIKGNTLITKYCLPYNNGVWPTGNNKVIGSVEDTKYNTVIFFVWNSLSKHQILRYYRDVTSPANPYGEVRQVIQYDFGWTKRTKIDSANIVYGVTETGDEDELTGDLLYWSDKTPRKINLTKAEVCTKLKCWDLYLPVTIDGNIPNTTTYTFKDFSGATVFSKTVDTSNYVVENKTIKYIRNTVDGVTTYEIQIFDAEFNFSGVSSFTIAGSTTPAHNISYDIIGWRQVLTSTIIEVSGYPAPDYSQEDVSVIWNVPESQARNYILQKIADAFSADVSSPVSAEFCDCSLEFCEEISGTVWTIESDADANIISPSNWYGATLIERFFDRCKWQPLNAPQGTFEKDVNYEPNYVQRKVFQFRLEYNYDDLERSALGVWSQIPINNLGCDGTSDKSYNYIDVDFNDTLIPNAQTLVLLKRIRFIARELNTGADRAVISLEPCEFLDYANGEWYCHFKFYNNIISSPIDAATAAKLFDNVPLESNDERYVKNRLVEGGILEGYDAPECVKAKVQMEFTEQPNKKLVKVRGKIRILTYGLSDGENNPNIQDPFTGFVQRNFYNAFPGLHKYPFWDAPYNVKRGGIFHDITRTAESDGGDFPFFGGGGFGVGGGFDFGIRAGMESTYDQRIPEAGFPVYVAGEQFLTISKQINIGLPTDSDGALDTSTEIKRNRIGSYYSTFADLYSEFEILVPANSTYILRLASHWCSFDDKLGKGFMYNLSNGTNYQKTSTNVWCVYDSSGNQVKTKEIKIAVGDSDIDDCGTFLVADLAPAFDMDFDSPFGTVGEDYMGWQPINGYLVCDADDAGASDINGRDFVGIPMEKSIVTYSLGQRVIVGGEILPYSGGITSCEIVPALATPPYKAQTLFLPAGWGEVCITDHNGYWFGIGGAQVSSAAYLNTDNLKDGDNWNYFMVGAVQSKLGNSLFTANDNVWMARPPDSTLYVGSATDYYNKTLSPTNFDGTDTSGAPLVHCFVAVTKAETRANAATFITGDVLDVATNEGVGNLSVTYQNGVNVKTFEDGSFNLPCWCDILTPNVGQFLNPSVFRPTSSTDRIVDILILSGSFACDISYQSGQTIPILITSLSLNGTTTAPPYSITAKYDIGDFFVNESANPSIKARKRGGNYPIVGRGYDNAGRLCSCFELAETYIPFITEDIGKYGIEDFSGAVYPSSTFLYGKLSLRVILDAATTFPTWMSYLQVMFPKNTIYGRYLQWVANKVTYIASLATDDTPEIQTSFQNIDATAVKISLANILDYESQNNDSQIGYQYQDGDRLRIITDRSLNYINGLNDFEITGYDSTTQEIIIKPSGYSSEIQSGSLFEIFNPKSVATQDSQIFYECGIVIKITNGIPENYTIDITGGDTYWRGRTILVNDEANNFASVYPVVIEDASVSDFYPSEAQDIGRIGIIDPAFKQVYAPTKVRCSNVFLPSTAVNGLSSFEELNQKEFDRSNGQIERLLVLNNTIIAVTSQREISNYIEVVSFQQADTGDGVLAIANQYFGTEYPHAKRLGTDHPSSVLINDGQAFGFQGKRGDAWRYQGDGEATISNNKMRNYFEQLERDGTTDAIAVYHRFNDEYILTVWRKYQYQSTILSVAKQAQPFIFAITTLLTTGTPLPELNSTVTFQHLLAGTWTNLEGTVTQITAVAGGSNVKIEVSSLTAAIFPIGQSINIIYPLPETIVFFNGDIEGAKDRWVRFDSRTPERWEQLGSGIVSFKDGRVWMEDTNALYNNFYGTQYESDISVVFNQEPDKVKVFNSLWLGQNQDNKLCNWRSDLITNENGQLSRLNNANIVKKENVWYVDFKRDLTDTTVSNPIINGRRLRGATLTVKLSNNYTGEVSLAWAKANWTFSERTTK